MTTPFNGARRGLLAGALGLAASSALAPVPVQAASWPSKVIDVHHHFFPPALVSRKRREILLNGPTFPQVLDWKPEDAIQAMDRAGVALAVLSITTPGVWFDELEADRLLARDCNQFAVEMRQNHPGRFGVFAALPLPDIEGSLREIAHSFDELKVDGVGLMTSHGGVYPGDPRFAPVFEELNRREAVVYFHPTGLDCCRNIVPTVPPASIEFPFDSTRAVASLLTNGTFARYRKIRWIFSHGGGTIPMLAQRLTLSAPLDRAVAALMPEGPMAELRKLYYDTCSVENEPAYAALRRFAPLSQILFGSDFPYGPMTARRDALLAVEPSQEALDAIAHRNPTRIMPQFA